MNVVLHGHWICVELSRKPGTVIRWPKWSVLSTRTAISRSAQLKIAGGIHQWGILDEYAVQPLSEMNESRLLILEGRWVGDTKGAIFTIAWPIMHQARDQRHVLASCRWDCEQPSTWQASARSASGLLTYCSRRVANRGVGCCVRSCA